MASKASDLKALGARLVVIVNHLRQLDLQLVFITLLLSGDAVYADTDLASHKCTAPMKQREFATQAQLERYKSAVELYRSCLEAFVKEQETAIETHRQAAQNAIGDWNRFVGQETKEPPRAPEDKRDNQEFRGNP